MIAIALKSVLLLDVLPAGTIRPDLAGRSQFDRGRDGVLISLVNNMVWISSVGVPLSRVLRMEALHDPHS